MKTALIWGVTGQAGSYLSELLLSKDYHVVGVCRRVSVPNTTRITHLLSNPNFEVVPGDITDALCVHRIIQRYAPDEIYNLAAQSFVGASFDEPSHTWDVTARGVLNCLEAIRNLPSKTKFFQASSSEMFGSSYSESHSVFADPPWTKKFQDELTYMKPNSPYAIAKLAAHHAVRIYREAYGIFACSGILFNYESSRRGEEFVTRKITKYVSKWYKANLNGQTIEPLRLGNLKASRDWGHAQDYVRAMWMMLQRDDPDDYVVATGETHTVETFLLRAFALVGYKVDCVEELPVVIDPSLYRPCEVPYLRGCADKAKRVLGWSPEISFDKVVEDMVYADIGAA